MNKRQIRMARRAGVSRVKQSWPEINLVASVLALAVFIVIVGLLGHRDQQLELYQATINTCERSHQVIDGKLEAQCGDLIDQTEKSSNVEVLSQNGKFWIEFK